MKFTLPRLSLALFAGLLLAPIAWFTFKLFSLGLEIQQYPTGVRINVGWLGEYQSHLSEISIRSYPEGVLVWEASPVSGSIQVWSFVVSPGENPRVLKGLEGNPTVRVVAPHSDTPVRFEPGRHYIVFIASHSGSPCLPMVTCREAKFTLR
jgi:hypothetical protein